jgi:beta-glucosidase
LLAHASASKLYQQKYKAAQGGQVSFTTLVTWPEPVSSSAEDRRASQNMLDSEVGWFLDPVFFGDYPGRLARLFDLYGCQHFNSISRVENDPLLTKP